MLSGNKIAGDLLRVDQDYIAFIGSSLTFRECHINAVQSEYPDLCVRRYSNFAALIEESAHKLSQIKVVLFDEALSDDIIHFSKKLLLFMPSAIFAMTIGRAQPLQTDLDWVVANRFVKSILPMDLRLNVWLSAIRLMVDGGEYLPQASQIQSQNNVEPIALPKAPMIRSNHFEESDSGSLHLTPREADVLRYLEQGLQNKLIADRLGLSEHTVKLHIHRIISKLGATNRTQAVSLYRQRQTGGADATAIEV